MGDLERMFGDLFKKNDSGKHWHEGAFGDIIGGIPVIGDMLNTHVTRETNKTNFDLEKENLDYQKDLQTQIFAREDNAHQREVADLKAAGLNPILAAGGSGSGAGAPIHTTAPQRQPALGDGGDAMEKVASLIMSAITMGKNFAVQDADIALKGTQAYSNSLENKMKELDLKYMQDKGISRLNSQLEKTGNFLYHSGMDWIKEQVEYGKKMFGNVGAGETAPSRSFIYQFYRNKGFSRSEANRMAKDGVFMSDEILKEWRKLKQK